MSFLPKRKIAALSFYPALTAALGSQAESILSGLTFCQVDDAAKKHNREGIEAATRMLKSIKADKAERRS